MAAAVVAQTQHTDRDFLGGSPIYSHGQLYVAISWVTSGANIKIFNGQGPNRYMRNVVYKEVLEM